MFGRLYRPRRSQTYYYQYTSKFLWLWLLVPNKNNHLCLFQSSSSTSTSTTTSKTMVQAFNSELLTRAASVRRQVGDFPSFNDLYFPSAYQKYDDDDSPSWLSSSSSSPSHMRGFCNWVLPNRLMVGQYPGQVPESSGPSAEEVYEHLNVLLQSAGVTIFCSLQSEIPSQTNYDEWEKPETIQNGGILLQDSYWRQQFPNPFTHYAPIVQSIAATTTTTTNDTLNQCQFWHEPIEDLSVPDSSDLQALLLKILNALDNEHENNNNNDNEIQHCIYMHCWGGRGRAGLVSACLMSLLYPEVDATTILDLIQTGYDSRLGSDKMPKALSKSPQTESQRAFVRSFVQERQRQWRKK